MDKLKHSYDDPEPVTFSKDVNATLYFPELIQ